MKTLFKVDTKDRLRFWKYEVSGDSFRTIAGIVDVETSVNPSEWTVCEPKNVGRSNATTAEQQALSEAESRRDKKLKQGWYQSKEQALQNANPFEPMSAQTYPSDPDKQAELEKWHKVNTFKIGVQPKLDGIRCYLKKDGGFSRGLSNKFQTISHIEKALEWVFRDHPDLILDGELYNHRLHDDFSKIVGMVKREKVTEQERKECEDLIQFYIYDCYDPNYPKQSFEYRSQFLENLFAYPEHPINYIGYTEVENSPQEIENMLQNSLDNNFEGVMLRDLGSPYEFKRSKGLWKVKKFYDDEFEIVGFEEGKGNWSGAAKKVLYKLPNDDIGKAGMTGTYKENADILINQKDYIGGQVTVKHQGFTKDGALRFPTKKHLYKAGRDL